MLLFFFRILRNLRIGEKIIFYSNYFSVKNFVVVQKVIGRSFKVAGIAVITRNLWELHLCEKSPVT